MRRSPGATAAAGLLLLISLLLAGVGGAVATDRPSIPPPLPVELPRQMLAGLGVGPLAPGGSSALHFEVANPFGAPITSVVLDFAVYAFNPTPGGAPGPLPADAPTLSDTATSGANLSLGVGMLAAHESGWSTTVTVEVPGGCPSGTFAIRDRLQFELNGTAYLLESIGNFPPGLWQNASVLANGTPTVNLTRLGVSGVLPETAVFVDDSAPLDLALYTLLGAAGVLGAAGGYLALRRRGGPSSSSGARMPPEESQAPTALGNSRSNAGD